MNAFAPSKMKRAGSNFAMAIALVTGAAVGVAALETPAHAAKKKKEKKSKVRNSKAFSEQFKLVDPLLKADPVDAAALEAAVPNIQASIETPDDRYTAGAIINNIGFKTGKPQYQRMGIDLMLESGKVPAENLAGYYYNSGQLAWMAEDWAAARGSFEKAHANGFNKADLIPVIADTYFRSDDYASGLAYLRSQIDASKNSGQTPSEDWIKRGLAGAFNNDLTDEALEFSNLFVQYYPSETSWGDAVAIRRNMLDLDDQAMLDLLRLAARAEALRTQRDYLDYAQAADVRRLPGEVGRILAEGIAAGKVDANQTYVRETTAAARAQTKALEADMAGLARDAKASGANADLATAAADIHLSYGKAAMAEELYRIALTRPGVDAPRVLNRIGIAQLDQGKTAEASETFAKVEGARAAIAQLWQSYIEQEGRSAAPAAAAVPVS